MAYNRYQNQQLPGSTGGIQSGSMYGNYNKKPEAKAQYSATTIQQQPTTSTFDPAKQKISGATGSSRFGQYPISQPKPQPVAPKPEPEPFTPLVKSGSTLTPEHPMGEQPNWPTFTDQQPTVEQQPAVEQPAVEQPAVEQQSASSGYTRLSSGATRPDYWMSEMYGEPETMKTYADTETDDGTEDEEADLGFIGDNELNTLIEDEVKGGLSGDDPEIKSLVGNHEKDVARMLADGMAEARAIAAEKGYAPGTEQYNQIMRNARKQINDATSDSQKNLYGAIRNRREDALSTAMDLRDQLWGEGSDLFSRQKDSEKDHQGRIDKIISLLPHQGIKNIAATFSNADDLQAWLKTVIDPDGKVLDRYRDTPWEVVNQKAGDMLRAENPEIAAKYTDSDGNFDYESFIKDSAIQPKVGEYVGNILKAEYDPIGSSAEDREEKEKYESDLTAAIESGDYSGLTEEHYLNMTPEHKKALKEKAKDWEAESAPDYGAGWDDPDIDPDNIYDKTAKLQYTSYMNKKGVTEGQVYTKDGKTYIVTDVGRMIKTTGDNKRRATFAIDVNTGKEVKIHESYEYENPNAMQEAANRVTRWLF